MGEIINIKMPSLKDFLVFSVSFSAGFFLPGAFMKLITSSFQSGGLTKEYLAYKSEYLSEFISLEQSVEEMPKEKALYFFGASAFVIYLLGKISDYIRSFGFGFLLGMFCRVMTYWFLGTDVAVLNPINMTNTTA